MLTKNENNILPLKKNGSIALIGPFGDNKQEMFSMWSFSGDANSEVTLLEGIKKQNAKITYAQGTQITDDTLFNKKKHRDFDAKEQQALVIEALIIVDKADVVVAVLGESSNMPGEAKSRTDISIPNCQREWLKTLKTTGKKIQ